MSPRKRIALALSGSRFMQRRLAKRARFCQNLMGIGSGGEPDSSGERRVFDEIRRRSDGPWCVLDVGANRGQFLKIAIESMPADRTTFHCFEPGVSAFAELERAVGGAPNVRLNRLAVGRAAGAATLHYDRPGSGLASLTRRDLAHFGVDFSASEPVQVTTVDAYCEQANIERVDLLKLDIEGHELDALHGAERLLATGRVETLTFEFGGCNIDTRTFLRDYWKLLTSHGMRIARITPSGFWSWLERYEEEHEQFRTTNFVAVRETA